MWGDTMLITEAKAKELIYDTKGAIFGVKFIKKDQSLREMTCRLHVKKHLVHKENPRPSTTAHIDKYITVFEMCGEAAPKYRNINLETMVVLNVDGKSYQICHDENFLNADDNGIFLIHEMRDQL